MNVKNQRWYADKGALGSVYFETNKPDVMGKLTKGEWDAVRIGMTCTAPENFADTKGVLEKLCHDTGECVYIQNEAVQNFFRAINEINSQ